MAFNSMELSDTTIGELEAYMEELNDEIADTKTALFLLDEDDDYDERTNELQMFLEELESAYAELDLIWDLKCEIPESD